VAVVAYIAGFALSWGPVVWVMLSEIFPNVIKAKAMAIAVAVQWIANWFVSMTFKVLDGSSALNALFNHGFAYWIYGIMSVLAALFVIRCVPETKGRTLESIQHLDAPLPGIGNWEEIKQSPLLWHFNFRGPDEERLVAGRERIYLDRFYNELSADPKKINEATRRHYAALYARPHAMHDAFEQFGAFNQDAIDDKALLAKGGKLTMPVLALGGEKSFGTAQADTLRFVAANVTMGIVPGSGHWIMDENPTATTALIINFLSN
jgi:hypothetical protein